MSDLNIWSGTGRLTRDAEQKVLPSGTTLVSFDIANNTGWGEYKKVIFLTCNLWGKTGTGVFNYLKKGKLVAVSGELQIQKWTSNQDGLEKSKNVINCRECLLMPDGSSKQSSSQDSYAGNDTSGYEDDGGDIPY